MGTSGTRSGARELSIVVPTCRRGPLLAKCLAAIAQTTSCDYEVIVVSGDTDVPTQHAIEQARSQMGDRLRLIEEGPRQGFVHAANLGFSHATGRYLTWLNDDARPLDHSLDSAITQLAHESPAVGQLAMFHAGHSPRNIAYQTMHAGRSFQLSHVRGTLYANFGVSLRSTYELVGYFDSRFYLNGADPDFSLKIWNAGLRVEPAYLTAIDHDETPDARRGHDSPRSAIDNALLFEKWLLPERNPSRNDFDPRRPCTLAGLSPTSLAS